MTNPQITTDLATILERIEAKIDRQYEQLNAKIDRQGEHLDGKIEKLDEKIDKLAEQFNERFSRLEVGQVKVEEKLISLEDKIKIQDKRLDSIEFVNRGIFVGLILAVLGGFAKIFGFIGNAP
ncbi:MAG: hemolytic enterotoxin [Hydrococcus sp. Prado102]|jgi:predicted nuclease with TOPRIM domain|nr:hemolytic enterotoxin [Hydrococcus sp. Prado102]